MYCVFVDACISFSDLRDRVRRKRTISKALHKINPTKTHIVANGKSKPQSSLTSHSENWIKMINIYGWASLFSWKFLFYSYTFVLVMGQASQHLVRTSSHIIDRMCKILITFFDPTRHYIIYNEHHHHNKNHIKCIYSIHAPFLLLITSRRR